MDVAKLFVAGVIVAGAALSFSAPAGADPAEPGPAPSPAPSAPQAAAPGTEALGPPPPPALQPSVPEVTNPTYGSGAGGPLGTIRDLWHQAHDGPLDTPEGVAGRPANAGPAPQLPPGYISTNAPESSNPGRIRDPYAAPEPSGPPLPPGYHSLNGPPPPGYEPTGPAPAAATP
ncbi:hypothetical protein [Mycobacteroides abscessus]|uniref:FHA domain-containing protein n=2 Tax=Mycobacteroides abscessus TaxID=36809 RepID=A0AB33AB62_9MYCO|nr:hypothetical protein [Mycobacteroides abscessus]AGM29023.1 hypothetical protein MASS_2421 [Mycobacteroides abscessus subsp. bolletii 50594]RIT43144.1 hypothetical protein D2E80_21655 [Mycobacteroides abscessus]SKI52357.1 Uncharacterised protein [Mycobacteroides abscessus subsp. massiliense]SKI64700.1 Uncharacterised protein [Mycobacteroides abscessus subsp. massiliense]SKJ21894.1 Uncharacterised protein [Mycobacteroides abscessus subsp. massiliense]